MSIYNELKEFLFMKKLVYIDACIRDEDSRTKKVATPIIEALRKNMMLQHMLSMI